MTILTGPSFGPAAGGKPQQLVVLCHGVGADGHDLLDLAPYFARVLPHAFFAAPDAPEPYDMAPYGRQWFSIGDLDPAKLGEGVRRAQKHLDAFIDSELLRLGVTDYALLGFSQGAMTALFTGLRRAAGPQAILAYSGALIGPESLRAELKSKPAVLLAHGAEDDLVPAFRSDDAYKTLRGCGVPVEKMIVPGLGHGLDEAGMQAGAALLQRVFTHASKPNVT
jgi:phospholipase/carboxylesterase